MERKTATSVSGFSVGENLESWILLLEEWLLTTERFYRLAGQNKGIYKYNERIHVSILAGAAWRCGWGAICEFKRKKSDTERAGRADLWIRSFDKDFLCEAKFKYVDEKANEALETLERACSDALKKYTEMETPCGVAFLCPSFYIEKNTLNPDIESFVDIIQDMKNNMQIDACAWCFPTYERFEKGGCNDYLPEIALIVKIPPPNN